MVRTNKKATEVEFFFGGFDDLSSAKRAFDVKKAKKREAEDADADERARKSANRNKALLCYLLPMLAFSVGALYYTFALLLHPEPQYVLAELVPRLTYEGSTSSDLGGFAAPEDGFGSFAQGLTKGLPSSLLETNGPTDLRLYVQSVALLAVFAVLAGVFTFLCTCSFCFCRCCCGRCGRRYPTVGGPIVPGKKPDDEDDTSPPDGEEEDAAEFPRRNKKNAKKKKGNDEKEEEEDTGKGGKQSKKKKKQKQQKDTGKAKVKGTKGTKDDEDDTPPVHYSTESRCVAYTFLLLFVFCTLSFVYLGVVRGNRGLTLAQASIARAWPGAAARWTRKLPAAVGGRLVERTVGGTLAPGLLDLERVLVAAVPPAELLQASDCAKNMSDGVTAAVAAAKHGAVAANATNNDTAAAIVFADLVDAFSAVANASDRVVVEDPATGATAGVSVAQCASVLLPRVLRRSNASLLLLPDTLGEMVVLVEGLGDMLLSALKGFNLLKDGHAQLMNATQNMNATEKADKMGVNSTSLVEELIPLLSELNTSFAALGPMMDLIWDSAVAFDATFSVGPGGAGAGGSGSSSLFGRAIANHLSADALAAAASRAGVRGTVQSVLDGAEAILAPWDALLGGELDLAASMGWDNVRNLLDALEDRDAVLEGNGEKFEAILYGAGVADAAMKLINGSNYSAAGSDPAAASQLVFGSMKILRKDEAQEFGGQRLVMGHYDKIKMKTEAYPANSYCLSNECLMNSISFANTFRIGGVGPDKLMPPKEGGGAALPLPVTREVLMLAPFLLPCFLAFLALSAAVCRCGSCGICAGVCGALVYAPIVFIVVGAGLFPLLVVLGDGCAATKALVVDNAGTVLGSDAHLDTATGLADVRVSLDVAAAARSVLGGCASADGDPIGDLFSGLADGLVNETAGLPSLMSTIELPPKPDAAGGEESWTVQNFTLRHNLTGFSSRLVYGMLDDVKMWIKEDMGSGDAFGCKAVNNFMATFHRGLCGGRQGGLFADANAAATAWDDVTGGGEAVAGPVPNEPLLGQKFSAVFDAFFWYVLSLYGLAATTCLCGCPAGVLGHKRFRSAAAIARWRGRVKNGGKAKTKKKENQYKVKDGAKIFGDWQECTNAEGKRYFRNVKTGERKMNLPGLVNSFNKRKGKAQQRSKKGKGNAQFDDVFGGGDEPKKAWGDNDGGSPKAGKKQKGKGKQKKAKKADRVIDLRNESNWLQEGSAKTTKKKGKKTGKEIAAAAKKGKGKGKGRGKGKGKGKGRQGKKGKGKAGNKVVAVI